MNKPSSMMGANNKGTSSNLIDYLEKENDGKEGVEIENFFNLSGEFDDRKAKEIIDSANKRLSQNDTKFYMFTINPSWREQKHLEGIVEQKTGVKYDKNNRFHKKEFNNLIKDYTKDVMQVYVDSFNRKGVDIKKEDLNFVAKVEDKRRFSHWEKEVRHNKELTKKIDNIKSKLSQNTSKFDIKTLNNQIKNLEKEYLRQDKEGNIQSKEGKIIKTDLTKEGRNTHVHVVVSRQTKSQYYKGEKVIDANGKKLTNDAEKIKNARPIKLSPNANSRGESDKHKLNGNKVNVGFNNENFKEQAGKVFNEKFNYQAKSNESYKSKQANTIDNKALESVKGKIKGKIQQKIKDQLQGEVAKTEIKIIKTVKGGIKNPVKTAKSFLKGKIKEIIKGG